MGIGCDHQVTVVVGEEVHQDKAALAPIEQQILLVAVLFRLGTEDTVLVFRVASLDVGHAPGRPEMIHRSSLYLSWDGGSSTGRKAAAAGRNQVRRRSRRGGGPVATAIRG